MKSETKTRTRRIRTILIMVLSLTLIFSLSACGGSGSKNDSDSGSAKTKTIKIASGEINAPYCYLDDDGNLTGYEYAVLDQIQKLLPQYKFDYEALPFEDVLDSVSSGKAQMAAWQFEKNKEREKNYLFSKEAYADQKLYLTVYKDNNTVKSLDDLHDCTVNGGTGQEYSYQIIKKYAEEHPEKNIKVITSSNNLDEAGIEAMKKGSTIAVISDDVTIAQKNKQLGSKELKIVGKPLHIGLAYYVFAKDETQLRDDFDGAIKKLKENGKLAKLQKKWLGTEMDELQK